MMEEPPSSGVQMKHLAEGVFSDSKAGQNILVKCVNGLIKP